MVWGVVTRAEGHMPPGRDGLFPANAMGERGEESCRNGTGLLPAWMGSAGT